MTVSQANTAITPDGRPSSARKDGIAAQTLTPLQANGTYSTGWIETTDYTEIYAVVFSDQVSASPNGIVIDYSNDGTTVLDSAARPFTAVNDFSRSSFPVTTRYIRYTYNNGATAQTKFQLTVNLLTTPLGSSKTTLGNTVNSLALAETTRGPIEQPSTNTGTDFTRVTQTTSGTKTAMDVNMAQPASATVTTATTLATVTTVLPANPNRKGATFFSVTGTILIKEGTGASATNFTARVVTNGMYELQKPVYTGVITAIGAGTLNVTEEV